MKIVVFGLSLSSSWGNGHATTYRALLKELHRRKHHIVFFEKNEEWYASNRDLPNPDFCELHVFDRWSWALSRVRRELADCDAAILGSFFPDGIRAARELFDSRAPVKAFYDIDTPITYSKLTLGGAEYLTPEQVAGFDLYLSFTAGPILERLKIEFGARHAVPLYCSFEPDIYYPGGKFRRYESDLSYMGTYAPNRQEKLQELFLKPAQQFPGRKFIVAGSQYPARLKWPLNVRHIRHLSPRWHPHFYSSSGLTLNLTRGEMVKWGYSPSVRLFEAAGCACPIVSDVWPGLSTVFKIGKEVLVAEKYEDIVSILSGISDAERREVGLAARERVLLEHTASRRTEQLLNYLSQVAHNRPDQTASVLPPTNLSALPSEAMGT